MTDRNRAARSAALALALLALAACDVPVTTIVAQPAPTPLPAPLPAPQPAPASPVAPTAPAAAPAAPPAPTGPSVSPIEEAPTAFESIVEPELTLVRGYRTPNDPCQIAGESRLTRPYLDESSDLVACLTGGGAAATLVSERQARPVAQTLSYTLYQVPRG